ncbi:DEAD/DEAH box helicase [Pseudonocardia sp. WMMC193]|uniref:DEAD/DEAH box helicase n=1 Tax=Pseudonocardia sp. WMMC193 TaxID=2911965 RepID=UPI001F378663|nr:DEAD/DEAH box helicase [Pseudonocardia sp. WMMC193]MCF7547150.1 DEAD/DEAH box helicase [Pseudonocardia sp. WMMC193]MCF7547244.1 DEAD/DEAH box helicase [Pseudonocardia sp. WMMC193]
MIEALRQEPTNSERGTKFEQLMVRYFQLDPLLSQQYDEVSRWIDWPGRDGKADTGIDLVARARDTGEYTAVQCKFYEPTTTLAKSDIDSFFTASGKKPFTNRIIISTTDKWGKNAEDALEDQTLPVQRIGLAEIADSPVDWDIAWPAEGLTIELSEARRHEPREHQKQAIDRVFAGFAAGHDRGKLIMACGTGKTFTALKIAERAAAENGGSARILFAVPSISLLSQTLREWTAQTQLDLRAFAVCSDTKVSRAAEDIDTHDVAIPVTTSPERLTQEMAHRKRAKGLTVVFTTYQSLPVVSGAQKQGVDPFDLVICDEAHRTTGVTVAGADESNFVRVHDADFLRATRRLYMTATPRIFDENVKAKADEVSAELASMDDEAVYGPEFHRLSFGEAVERGLLTDYKVLVLTVDEELVAAPLQAQFAGSGGELRLDDATKIVGCWNGLAKRAGRAPDGSGFPTGALPMRRAVAFAQDIASSKKVAELFPRVVDAYRDLLAESENDGSEVNTTNVDLSCEVDHVDGTFNALKRNEKLRWLKAPVPEGECRILTNARCLSEGVDVPALDAVLFLHPRSSVVDVVQSVGRVMRKSKDKDYGYIILPVAVPAGVSPSQALSDNRRFKVVWQVLNALRAHDDRFNAMVNSIALNATQPGAEKGQGSDVILGGHIGATSDATETLASQDSTNATQATDPVDAGAQLATQMALFSLSEWQEAIFARIVDKVGSRTYWEDWARDVADIASALITRISALLDGADHNVATGFEQFLQGLRDNLNDSITPADAISMLAQHLITKPVFDALFASHEFAAHNPVSQVMESMLARLGDAGLGAETAHLEGFYNSVRIRAAEVTSLEGKQQVIADLYDRFFTIGFARQAAALGIVYTPVEIVDFILRSAEDVLRHHFGYGLTDEGVHILDGFTGTGTFLTRLMQSGFIQPADLIRKYSHELHANEIMLLAYYIAAVNIETTFSEAVAGAAGEKRSYEPFPGLVLTDTFQSWEEDDRTDLNVFPENNERLDRLKALDIQVIVGNPPWSVGQESANDNNQNQKYPGLDAAIRETYAERSTARSQRTLYDSYIRAIKWASLRIKERGIIAYVTNGGWLESNTADGMRLSLADEFSDIYVYNLRGNRRAGGAEGRPIWEAFARNRGGSIATVAIVVLVRDPDRPGPARIHYKQVGDFTTSAEKVEELKAALSVMSMEPELIVPNANGDWANQRNDEFGRWPALGSKTGGLRVFSNYSLGLATGRDAWCYNFSRTELTSNVQRTIDFYNSQAEDFSTWCEEHGVTDRKGSVDEFVHTDSTKINWNRNARQDLARGVRYEFDPDAVILGSYRPFTPQVTYFHRDLNAMLYQLPSMFPTRHHANIGIVLTGPASHYAFTPFMTDLLPNLHMLDTAQFFPRWTFKKVEHDEGALDLDLDAQTVDEYGYVRVDNITDEIQGLYTREIGLVNKDDIFYYIYGLLHAPSYRLTYGADLRKILPRIPVPSSVERFDTLSRAGRALADLHVNYESVDPYPLDIQLKPGVDPNDRETWRLTKLKWKKKDDFSAITYNSVVTIAGIPAEAERYHLGPRSALGWIIDRYQRRKPDKASGIVNDPNDWCDEHNDPRSIVSLIQRVTTVAVETMKIVDGLDDQNG